jgi:molybdenum cofactor synthesis domain-containing protein
VTDRADSNVSTRDDLDRLRQPDEARANVLQHARLLPVETVALDRARGRVLVETISATEDHPPFAAATMDGYAVLADDSSPWREIIGEQTAGFVAQLEVTPGVAVRITTGAPIPPGADAVIQVEHTELADDHVVIHQEVVRPGENIRPIGADLKRGESVLPAGTVLGPAEVGLLAGLGITPVPVRRRPRVSIISTGDELVEPDEPVGPGQIRDSNRFSLIAAVSELGDVIAAEKAPDQQNQLETLLRNRISASDIVITSGGVSMGQLDLVKVILDQLATVHFRRIFMKPGKPLNFATAGDTLIFGLPGNPVSALVNFEVFIRPAMATMMGQANPERPRVRVALAHDVAPTDRIELQRATVHVTSAAGLIAATTGVQASSRLASFIGANALLVIPPRETPYQAGEIVEALLLAPPENE